MPRTPRFFIQVFERTAAGLLTGARLPTASAAEAEAEIAEIAACFGGAAAMCTTCEGEHAVITVLASTGNVPPDFDRVLLAADLAQAVAAITSALNAGDTDERRYGRLAVMHDEDEGEGIVRRP